MYIGLGARIDLRPAVSRVELRHRFAVVSPCAADGVVRSSGTAMWVPCEGCGSNRLISGRRYPFHLAQLI
jgi:hypothetical protein